METDDDYPCVPCAPPAAASSQSQATGGQKRKKTNAFPRRFLVYSSLTRKMVGALVLVAVHSAENGGKVVWEVGSSALLDTPFLVQSSMVQYYGNVFKLTPTAEQHIRKLSVMAATTTLNATLTDMTSKSWSVMKLSDLQIKDAFCKDSPARVATFNTDANYAKAAGVTVSDENSTINETLQSAEDAAFDADELATGSAPVLGSEKVISEAARATLMGLHKEGTQGSGKYTFMPGGLLNCLQMRRHMKPMAKLSDALADAATLLLPPDDSRDKLQKDLRVGVVVMPSYWTLNYAKLKLDLFSVLFERLVFIDHKFLRYLMLDGSQQLGYDFLCCIESRFRFPRGTQSPFFWTQCDLNLLFEQRTMPVSTCGAGKGGAVKKATNVLNVNLMETETVDDFQEVCAEYKGCISDQGTERLVEGMSSRIVDKLQDSFEASGSVTSVGVF